jgi:UDP-N-acetylglucosamine 2-epimerase
MQTTAALDNLADFASVTSHKRVRLTNSSAIFEESSLLTLRIFYLKYNIMDSVLLFIK